MVEISGGLQKAVQKFAEQAAETAKSETAKPQQDDLLKFQDSMQQAAGGQDPLTVGDPLGKQLTGTPSAEAVAPAENPASPGDAVLQNLDKMRNDYQAGWQKIENLSEGGKTNLDPQELLRVQMEVQRVSVEVDLAGKVAGKGTQDVNQLLKNQ